MDDHNSKLNTTDIDKIINKARLITKKHIEKVSQMASEIEEKFRKTGPLVNLWGDVKLCQNLLIDYRSGHYKDIPFWVIATVALALLYFINPLELIPDVIPVIGYFDDALLVVVAVKIARKELEKYKAWKELNN